MSESDFWYGRPARTWVEALPVGNGRLGAMIFGGTERERLQINDGTAWSGTLKNERAEPVVTAPAAAAAITRARKAVTNGDFLESDAQLKTLQHRYTQSYLPFVDLYLTTEATNENYETARSAPRVDDYRRSLDLGTALHSVSYRVDGHEIIREVFVSSPDDVLVMTISTEAPRGLDLKIDLMSELMSAPIPSSIQGVAGLLLRLPADISPPVDEEPEPVTYSDDDSASMHGAVALRWTHDGEESADTLGDTVSATGVHQAVVYLTTKTTFVGIGQEPAGTAATAFEGALGTVSAAVAKGAAELRLRQTIDHATLFDRVAFEVAPSRLADSETRMSASPVDERLLRANEHADGVLAIDPELARMMFDYGRYLLISSSRPGGVPANLQGIWNDQLQAPWSGNYTTNINVEMNYWQAEVANLAELAEPLFDLIDVLAVRGRETAQRIYDAPGWVAHHNTDVWGYTQPVGRGHHEPRWAFWPLAGAWLVRHLWEHLLFGADDTFARERAWEPIRSSAEFYLSWLVENDDGTMGTSPSTSPENNFRTPGGDVASSAASSSMDVALISDVFRMTVVLAGRLGLESDAVAADAARALSRLPEPPIGRDGAVTEWRGDFEQVELAHRHLSHLYFVFPGDRELTPDLREAVMRSLDSRGEEATGWSLAWKMALRARVGQPEKVSELLKFVFRDMEVDRGAWIGGLYPNLLVAHPPFQIDGNFGFVAAIAECLLQSHRGRLDLLPALPAELATGRIAGLMARPGIEVDLVWQDAALISARLRPRSAASRRVQVVMYGGRSVEIDLTSPGEEGVTVTGADFSGRDPLA